MCGLKVHLSLEDDLKSAEHYGNSTESILCPAQPPSRSELARVDGAGYGPVRPLKTVSLPARSKTSEGQSGTTNALKTIHPKTNSRLLGRRESNRSLCNGRTQARVYHIKPSVRSSRVSALTLSLVLPRSSKHSRFFSFATFHHSRHLSSSAIQAM
jgi:hypothetical protein